MMSSNIKILILMGVLLRAVLFVLSLGHNGFWGGDAGGYIYLADHLLLGQFPLQQFFWPPGYPVLVALSQGLTSGTWLLILVQIGIFAVFVPWIYKKIRDEKGESLALFACVFLCFDPVWLSYTITLGADFLGACLFGFLVWSKPARWHGLAYAVLAFLKPIFQWVPLLILPLFRKKNLVWLIAFSMLWLIPILSYRYARYRSSGDSAFSGHNMFQFAKYIKGRMLTAQGLASSSEEGEAISTAEIDLQKNSEHFSITTYTIKTIASDPVTFGKLFLISTFRTVFGHANNEIQRFVSSEPSSQAGLWVNLSRGEGLWEKLKTLSIFYFLGVIISFAFRGSLVFFALRGLGEHWRTQKVYSICLVMMILYFACTPVVFGEPRLFMPATFLLFALFKNHGHVARKSLS